MLFNKLIETARNGDTISMFEVAKCYYYGKGVEENHAEALCWYKKAADAGYDLAMFNVAECYYYGKGTEKNHAEALCWYKKAADIGNEFAQNKLKEMQG